DRLALRSFPTRRSSDLLILREGLVVGGLCAALPRLQLSCVENRLEQVRADVPDQVAPLEQTGVAGRRRAVASVQGQLREHERLRDRKSTRLNSSHLVSS